MTPQVIERGRLGVLTKIGQGGQGVVFGAPNVTTKFAASMVYKEYKAATLAAIDFGALAAMPALVEESLSYADGGRLVSIAAWPCAIVEDGSASTGFVMPAIPQEFFISLTTVKGASSSTAEFQHLLNHSSVLAARGIEIDDAQRYSLLREVASGLAFLHKHGVCVGDISPKNLAQYRKKTAAPAVAALAAPEIPVVHSRPSAGSARPVRTSAPPPSTPPTWVPPASTRASSTAAIWAAVATVVAVIVVAAIVIAVVLAKHNTGTTSSAPQTSFIEPSSHADQSSTLPPTPAPAATAPPSPAGSAAIPGLAPFAREWDGMRESVVIDATGHGHFHYMMACASCSMADMPYGTLDFTLISVSGGTASGSVTASSDPQHPVGEPVAATLAPQDTIQWSVGGNNVGLFCGSNPAYCGY
ncbi:MAG: hypothetical protein WA622_10590 [Mycobacterium sp.]|uniref:hypothetical protein n=1 Tax=Mycobacterium sp. TaxID=1785 RepID=UPI003BB6E03D